MSDISIDENIIKFANEILPFVRKMQFFTSMQQQLYATFDNYKGGAKKEINEYSEKQMRQLTLMCEGYSVLSSDLIKIIQAFQITDDASKQKIEAFYSSVDNILQKESDRMKTVLDSLKL